MKRNNYNIHESDVIEEMINHETKYWSWSRSTVDANGNWRTLTAEDKQRNLQKYIDYVRNLISNVMLENLMLLDK